MLPQVMFSEQIGFDFEVFPSPAKVESRGGADELLPRFTFLCSKASLLKSFLCPQIQNAGTIRRLATSGHFFEACRLRFEVFPSPANAESRGNSNELLPRFTFSEHVGFGLRSFLWPQTQNPLASRVNCYLGHLFGACRLRF